MPVHIDLPRETCSGKLLKSGEIMNNVSRNFGKVNYMAKNNSTVLRQKRLKAGLIFIRLRHIQILEGGGRALTVMISL